MITEYKTKVFGEVVAVRANWSLGGERVEALGEDGWLEVQGCVGDYRHDPRLALRQQIEDMVTAGGDDPAEVEAEIVRALDLAEVRG